MKNMIISLCGFMGAGKSTIGKNLSRYMGYKFIDLDNYIEEKHGFPVTEFFSQKGEVAFREEECKALEEIIGEDNKNGLILSLGGGTVVTPQCTQIIKNNTFCIYLNCPKEILLKRLIKNNSKRPLLANKTQSEMDRHITELIKKREPLYLSCSHVVFNISPYDSLPATIDKILLLLATKI